MPVALTINSGCIRIHSFSQLRTQIKLAQTSSALETAAGLLLASVLIYYLQKSRTGFRGTESMINRIIMITIGTGLFPNIFAVLCFIFVCDSSYFILYLNRFRRLRSSK